MKRIVVCFMLLCCLIGTSFAQNRWIKYWLPGKYRIELTEEEKEQYKDLYHQMDENTADSSLRQYSEPYSFEKQYNDYLGISFVPEKEYDDVGRYTWALGLPDEHSISMIDAYMIACKALSEQIHLDDSVLVNCFPWFTYEVSYEQPCWIINFLDCREGTSVPLPYVVMIYAYDGSIGGYDIIERSNG